MVFLVNYLYYYINSLCRYIYNRPRTHVIYILWRTVLKHDIPNVYNDVGAVNKRSVYYKIDR